MTMSYQTFSSSAARFLDPNKEQQHHDEKQSIEGDFFVYEFNFFNFYIDSDIPELFRLSSSLKTDWVQLFWLLNLQFVDLD